MRTTRGKGDTVGQRVGGEPLAQERPRVGGTGASSRRRHPKRSTTPTARARAIDRSLGRPLEKKTHRHAQVDDALVEQQRGQVRRRRAPPIVARAARVHGHGGAARERGAAEARRSSSSSGRAGRARAAGAHCLPLHISLSLSRRRSPCLSLGLCARAGGRRGRGREFSSSGEGASRSRAPVRGWLGVGCGCVIYRLGRCGARSRVRGVSGVCGCWLSGVPRGGARGGVFFPPPRRRSSVDAGTRQKGASLTLPRPRPPKPPMKRAPSMPQARD